MGFMIKKPERLKLLQDAEREWPNYMRLLLLILYTQIYKKDKGMSPVVQSTSSVQSRTTSNFHACTVIVTSNHTK